MSNKVYKQVEMFPSKHVDVGHMIIKTCEHTCVCDN